MDRRRQLCGLPAKVASWYLVLFCLAFVFYSWLWKATPVGGGDYPDYARVARDLHGLTLSQVHLRPPGYPLLLKLTGSAREPSKALFFSQLGLHLGTIWLLGVLLARVGIGRLGLLLLACVLLLPPFVVPAGYALTEVLSAFLLATGLVATTFALAEGSVVLGTIAGLSFGYCGATHPSFLLVPFAVVACQWGLLFTERRLPGEWKKAVVLSASVLFGWLLVAGGLVLHNGLRFGSWRPSAFTGYALTAKTWKVVERLPKEFGVVRDVLINARNAALVEEGSAHTAESYIWIAREELERVTGLDTAGLSDRLTKVGLTLIKKAPMNYLSDVVYSAVGLWFPGGDARANMGSLFLQGTWFIVESAVVTIFWLQLTFVISFAFLLQRGLISPLPAIYCASSRQSLQSRVQVYCLALTLILYTLGIVALFGCPESRYRQPVEGFIVLLCMLGVRIWMEVCSARTSTRRAGGEDDHNSPACIGTPGKDPAPR